jgi:hypothetical protein
MVLMQRRWWWGIACSVVPILFATSVLGRPESGDGVVRFLYNDASASAVYVVGDWNGWSPAATPMDPSGDGTWLAEVFLDAGRYEYKLLVDGAWVVDPGNPEVSESGNSVVRVGATGSVLPPEGTSGGGDGGSNETSSDVRWSLRYLGYFTSRRQPETGRYALERPQHLIDVSLEANPTSDLDAWALMKINSLGDSASSDRIDLRYDRAQARWHPGSWDLRLLDNTQGLDFDDPAVLLGRVGIYEDPYGYRRRGVFVHKKLAGAPVQFVYTDNTESSVEADSLARFPGWDAAAYEARNSRRNADTIAFRFRGGRSDAGLGVSLRHDRGAYPGRRVDLSRGSDSLGVVAQARVQETTESWNAWGLDLSMKWSAVRLRAEYLSGQRHARAQSSLVVGGIRPDSLPSLPQIAPATVSEDRFDLSRSRRVEVLLDAGEEDATQWKPQLRYRYEEHHQGELVTGRSFLMRRHGFELRASPQWSRVQLQVQVAQDWFTYPQGATWQTQFWFRRHNPWLDEDVAGLQRFTLLGEETAATGVLQIDALLREQREIGLSYRLQLAAPGWHRAPRSIENVLRLRFALSADLSLRTHTRLVTYRRFETQDPSVVDVLGPGPHIEAGPWAQQNLADARHDHVSRWSHFIELVYEISSRSDIALGFGVDPWVLYTVRNEYMDIGWEQFVYAAGAGPAEAYADPEHLATRLGDAEAQLERERRLTLEARLRF